MGLILTEIKEKMKYFEFLRARKRALQRSSKDREGSRRIYRDYERDRQAYNPGNSWAIRGAGGGGRD
jgi:hypothetical protein